MSADDPRVFVMAPVAFAVDPSTWIVIGVILVGLMFFAYSTFSKSGSDIREHPVDSRGSAPGSGGPSRESGLGRVAEETDGDGADSTAFSSHGTR